MVKYYVFGKLVAELYGDDARNRCKNCPLVSYQTVDGDYMCHKRKRTIYFNEDFDCYAP